MLDSLACHSLEKLVIDAEAIASAQRLARGIEARTETLALGMFSQTGLHGDFLKLKETRALFRCEQHFASTIIDRSSRGENDDEVLNDTFSRARQRVRELRSSYSPAALSAETRSRLLGIAARETSLVGLAGLPGIEQTAPILGI
jgi:trimethylamine:corrinoid methyltransferase-like protein